MIKKNSDNEKTIKDRLTIIENKINPAIEVKRVFKLCGEQNSFGEL